MHANHESANNRATPSRASSSFDLDTPLERFEVSLIPGQPTALLNVMDEPEETSRWSLNDLLSNEEYVRAVAFKGTE
jgi:hypothetical protein